MVSRSSAVAPPNYSPIIPYTLLGSMAPQNGFGFGLAFVDHKTPNESWRLSWDLDGLAAPSGAWRAGGYMKFIHTPVVKFVPVHPGEESAGKN